MVAFARLGVALSSHLVKNAAGPDEIALFIGQVKQSGHDFTELADPLRVSECLPIALVHDPALHDVGVMEPCVQPMLPLNASAIDQ